MQNGNLSNVVTPKVLLVAEGTLLFIDGDRVDHANAYAAKGDWYEAWCQWEVNILLARKIWDVQMRQGIRVSLVTYIDDSHECSRGLEELMDKLNLPVREVIATDPEKLARELAYMPDVVRVYDGNRETAGMYGRKGVYLRDYMTLGDL